VNTTTDPIVVSYLITPTINGCNGTVKTVDVTVNPTSTISSTGTANWCNAIANTYNITSLTVPEPVFTWSRATVANVTPIGTSGTNDITETLTNSSVNPVTVLYVITPTINGCAGTPYTVTVTLNPTSVITSAATNYWCNNTSTSYTITSSSNTPTPTFTWTRATVTGVSNASGAGTGSPITETLVNTTTAPVAVHYLITPTVNNCAGTVADITVYVNPTGQVVLPSNQVKCKTDLTTVNFTTLNTIGSTSYSWSNSNTDIGLGATGTGNISFTAANATLSPISGTIEVTPTFTYGGTSCVGPSKTFTITVNPTGQVNDPTDLVKCNTDLTTTTFTTTNLIGTTTYAWANTNTGIGLGASGTGNISFTAANTGTAPITGTITVTPTFDNGGTICVGPSESFTITVNPTGQVNLPANQVKCNTDATTVTFTTTHTVGLTTYAWSNTNAGIGLGVSGTGDISFTATNAGTLPISGTIVVTPTFTYGLVSCT
jgi:hypothetical protein